MVAGVLVKASKAFDSDKPKRIAFLRLAKNVLLSLKSALLILKETFAFSKAAKLVGANSQCFISVKETKRASLGSSTSMASGKSTFNI